jgi:hypothetical protein
MSPFSVRFGGRLSRLFLPVAFLLPVVSLPLFAKNAGLTAIEVYPGSDGQSYVQIAGFVLNGKNEVYLCGGASSIDKNAYHKLAKVLLATGMSLERDANGVLLLTNVGAPDCVVPGNVKFEKDGALSPAQLADRTALEGTVLSGSDASQNHVFQIKPGVKLVFVAMPDQEFAEYLRAQQQGDIRGWQVYLEKYPSATHTTAGKKSLATLLVQAAAADLETYEASKGGVNPDYGKLKETRQLVDKARVLVPDDGKAADLNKKVHEDVLALSHASKAKLDLYQQALKQQTPGYVNLVDAEKLADAAFSVEPSTGEAIDAESQTKSAREAFDRVLKDTEARLTAHQVDEAARKIAVLGAFAQENSKVSADLQAVSDAYVADARKLEDAQDWPSAVKNLEKAVAIVSSPETMDLLKEAKRQGLIAANKAAAAAAMQKSQQAETNNDIISAFEVLDNLIPEQRSLVTERLASLQDAYVQAALAAAKGQQKAHEPINGISDEIGIQAAYGYLQRCYRLTNDPTLEDRISILADDLSAWYLQRGKQYVEKPDGTGNNVGWSYLSEAVRYKSQSNLGAVHDEIAQSRAAHMLTSRISLKVDLRDQASRREEVAFATQLTDALATGLESSGLSVKVIRPQETTVVQPRFQLIGDILRHDLGKSQEAVSKESKYRSAEHEIPNDAYNQANREFERANLDLQSARSALEGAEAHGKKGEIKDAKKVVAADEAKVEELHAKLDAIPQKKYEDVVRSYTYTQLNFHLKTAVELQFRILDNSGNEVVPRVPVGKENVREYSTLEGVNPEDTEGVKNSGVVPNDNEILEEDEYKARDELIQKAKEKVADLPGIVLSSADRKAADGDNDGAAELYILYLNSTPVEDTPERIRVKRFLADQFNFTELGKDAL